MKLKEILDRQGGFELIKQYWRGGALFTAVAEFALLGKSMTALEILRLSTSFKIKRKLEKKYRGKLEEFDAHWEEMEHTKSNIVWMCWFQGMDEAPLIVKRCYDSIKRNLSDREVILITNDNMGEYVTFPVSIQKKINTGVIAGAHLSDLLRLELLVRYGGTWIDSTVFCSGNYIPSYMLDSELFLFQNLKPGKDGHSTVISNWFISAWSNNKLLSAELFLLYQYWKDNSVLWDYYIFHDLFQIVIERYPDDWMKVVPFNNSTPHILLLRLFDQYDDKMWKAIIQQSPFHKLSYKFGCKDVSIDNTYYQKIMESNVTTD